PSCVPMNPPTTAPTMPRAMVRMIPPGILPGMRNLAIAPAIRPNTAHNRMPTVDLPFAVADFRGDLAARPGRVTRAEKAPLGPAPRPAAQPRSPARGQSRLPRDPLGCPLGSSYSPEVDMALHVAGRSRPSVAAPWRTSARQPEPHGRTRG